MVLSEELVPSVTEIMPAWGKELVRELYQRYAGDLKRLRRFNPLIPKIGKSYAGEERRLLYRAHLHPIDRAIGFERNPSLWILKVGPQETDAYPDVSFEPLQRNAAERLAYGARKTLAFCYAPLREMRRSLKREFTAGETAAPRRSKAN